MEYLRRINKELIILFLILVLASFVRLLWIDKVPNAIGGDELTYIVNSKSIFLAGTDISGTWNPLSAFIFKYPSYTTPQAELPYFLLAPIVGFTSFSLFSARITFVLFSIFTVLLIYLIAKELFNREVGLLSAFIAAINPWMIYIGRTDYESVPTIFFFLLGFYIIIKAKDWKILYSIPILFLAFYSYIGTKLLFLPFVVVALVYVHLFINKKQYLKQYLIVFLSCLFLIIFFVVSLKVGSGSRLGEIFTPNDPEVIKQVDAIRKVSIQTPFMDVFENKFTIYSRIVLTKLFKSLATDYLFVYGDNFFSILRHGMLYVIDALFLLMGIAAAYAKKRKVFFLLLIMVLLSLIPQIFHTADVGNMVYHIALMFPFIIILIAVGIWEVVTLVNKKSYFYVSSAIIGALYILLFFNFLNIYFFQWTLQDNFDFHVRTFSKYVSLSKSESREILVYSPNSTDIFKKYLFYTNSYNKDTYLTIRKLYKANKFTFGNIKFMGCDNTIDPTKTSDLIVYDFQCGNLKKNYSHLAISRLSDGGQNYEIFNDKICSQYPLKPYPSGIKIGDFSIENMSASKYCETYVTSH